MSRFSCLLAICLLPVPISNAALACPVLPFQEALVDSGLSWIDTALEVSFYELDEVRCSAALRLPVSSVPSRRLVPLPRELAAPLAPVAQRFGAKTCWIQVDVVDDPRSGATRSDPEECYRGTFQFDGGSWSTVEDDAPCW